MIYYTSLKCNTFNLSYYIYNELNRKEVNIMANTFVVKIEKAKSNRTKSVGSIARRYEHNLRTTHVPANVDPELSYLNRTLIELPNGKSYSDVYEEAIAECYKNGTMSGKIRKDAVLACECVINLNISKDENIDYEKWAKDSTEWLKETFGENNVKSAVLHMDESTGPHIHAFIVPINEKGRLSYKSFIDGKKDLSSLQTQYAEKVGHKYNLERGQKYSNIKAQTMYQFKNATIGKALIKEEDYKPREEELTRDNTITYDYVDRIKEVAQTERFQHLDEMNKLIQKSSDEQAILRQQIEELNLQNMLLRNQHEKEREDKTKLKYILEKDDISFAEAIKMIKSFKYLQNGLKLKENAEIKEQVNNIIKSERNKSKNKEKEIDKKLGL